MWVGIDLKNDVIKPLLAVAYGDQVEKKINKNKIAVVTGAGSGIGKNSLNSFNERRFFHTYLVGRNKINLDKTKNEAIKYKVENRCSIFKCDVTDEKNVKIFFDYKE